MRACRKRRTAPRLNLPIRAFTTALGFLTVWRLPLGMGDEPQDRGRSLYFFGAVGLIVGGLLVVVDFVTKLWPSAITNVLILVALLLATGGLHFDGLLDTCDGIFSHRTREQRLEVMRDSRSGAFAVAAGVLDLLLWWACSVDLTGPHHFAALLLMATTSRAGMVLAVTLFPYARPAGLGKDFRDHHGRWAGIVNCVLACGLGYALLGPAGLFGAGAGLASAILAGMYLMTRLPGLTGDCYGAVNEVAQIATLFALVPLLS
ncbi:MAG TPA: adenosylcobinamide-GDP ribazoletransferase [Chloroflexota bacterium]|nr:adenosylcobinamide-GDP ribazoletransferase [Chloroflexota bacterium]